MVSFQSNADPKPIAIEQADYSVMARILEFAEQNPPNKLDYKTRERIKTLLGRCKMMMDPNKVTLINEPMQNAVISNPEIIGCADRVVSNVAVGHYALERKGYFQGILESFLKPDGELLQFEGN